MGARNGQESNLVGPATLQNIEIGTLGAKNDRESKIEGTTAQNMEVGTLGTQNHRESKFANDSAALLRCDCMIVCAVCGCTSDVKTGDQDW